MARQSGCVLVARTACSSTPLPSAPLPHTPEAAVGGQKPRQPAECRHPQHHPGRGVGQGAVKHDQVSQRTAQDRHGTAQHTTEQRRLHLWCAANATPIVILQLLTVTLRIASAGSKRQADEPGDAAAACWRLLCGPPHQAAPTLLLQHPQPTKPHPPPHPTAPTVSCRQMATVIEA